MIDLQDAKDHLRVTHNLEDDLIQMYLDSATAHIEKYLGEDMPDPVPKPIDAAVLLLMADLYEHREIQGDRAMFPNPTYERLLSPYRVWEVC